MKTKLFFSIITIMVIFAIGCTPVNNNSRENKESEIGSIIRPQDFSNGVFYFDTYSVSNGKTKETKEYFGKSIAHFIQHNPEWKVSTITPVTHHGSHNKINGYFVICEPVKKQ